MASLLLHMATMHGSELSCTLIEICDEDDFLFVYFDLVIRKIENALTMITIG